MGKFAQHGQWSKHYLQSHLHCFRIEKDVSDFSSVTGWTWVSFRRHHLCIRGHGSRWILLCEHNLYNFYTTIAASLLLYTSLHFLSILGGSTRTTRFGTIQLSAASPLGLEERPHTRIFATNAKPQIQWDNVSNCVFFNIYIIVRHCICFRWQVYGGLCK